MSECLQVERSGIKRFVSPMAAPPSVLPWMALDRVGEEWLARGIWRATRKTWGPQTLPSGSLGLQVSFSPGRRSPLLESGAHVLLLHLNTRVSGLGGSPLAWVGICHGLPRPRRPPAARAGAAPDTPQQALPRGP